MYKTKGGYMKLMKKIFAVLLVLSIVTMVSPAFAIDEWLKGQPNGGESPSEIDTLIQVNNEALDRFMTYGRFGCKLAYSSVSTLTVFAGSISVSNTSGTIRKTRANTSATSVTFSNLDTGSEEASNTYYVYAVGDTDTTTFTIKISKSSTLPSGVSYYQRLGYFFNDSSSNISRVTDDDFIVADHTHDGANSPILGASAISGVLGAWESKSNNTVYQAETDGFVCAQGIIQTDVKALMGATSPPTVVFIDATCGTSVSIPFTFPVKKGDYWKTEGAAIVYWIPLGA